MAKKHKDEVAPLKSKPMGFKLPAELIGPLEAFMNAQRVPPSQTDVVVVALQEFLQREGFYPSAKK
ncbi:hypothetical protein [Zavarzinella formosa]|uniref:hypothetical protein n=1 Tax=Zavarzinella formosa TaxID=360055 RepID=UPI0002DEB22F|nr:hypothetical protein [Zavarzinella formosa]